MEDIKKAIEEEARNILLKADELPPEANYFGRVDHIKREAKDILELLDKLQSSSRWRKVEEELPEVKEKPYWIIVRPDADDDIFYPVQVRKGKDMKYILEDDFAWQPIND